MRTPGTSAPGSVAAARGRSRCRAGTGTPSALTARVTPPDRRSATCELTLTFSARTDRFGNSGDPGLPPFMVAAYRVTLRHSQDHDTTVFGSIVRDVESSLP